MNKFASSKSCLYKKIEDLYFSDKFKEVVAFWEENKRHYQIEKSNQSDNNILEAIATSYYEIKKYNKSLYYINKQLEQLKTLAISDIEKSKKYRYYYLNKINIYNKKNKKILEYKTIWEYVKLFGKDDVFLRFSDALEEYFYTSYIRMNKYLGSIILLLIIVAIIIPMFNIHIPSIIYKPYNVLSSVGVVWAVINLLFPSAFKKCLLNCLRYLFRPR